MANKSGMQSLKSLYKVGRGPSSSHTIGPELAAITFKKRNPNADSFCVTLYGSLALTGEGHMTDKVLVETLSPTPCEVVFDLERKELPHPNTMLFSAFKGGMLLESCEVLSIGGGNIRFVGGIEPEEPSVYKESSFSDIARVCDEKGLRLWEYVELNEGPEIWVHLAKIWLAMKNAINDGLSTEGELSGGLHVQRKAKYLYTRRHMDESATTKEDRLICAYAFAVSEQNASCGTIVTAPTCGSAGVLPAVLRYEQETRGFDDIDILHALATAGIIGNLIRTNASTSGAECGCQAEIGSACSMAAAALAELFGMDINQIEYAAEVAMEHHLGLTCDPIGGLVQIPCIERNAVAACRALNAVTLANFLTTTRKISFDLVVQTMYETGRDINNRYKETSKGGLAKLYS